jgi:hypothetical protein
LAPGRCKLRGRAWVGSENRQVKGYDHGYDADVFYFGLALDTKVC